MPETVENIENDAAKVAKLLKALSNEKRLMIVCALCNGEQSVGILESKVELSQSALSQHLAKLRRNDLVRTRREAQSIYYRLNDESGAIKELLRTLCKMFTP